jgi:hypothetical protein
MAINFKPITAGGRAIWSPNGFVGNADPINFGPASYVTGSNKPANMVSGSSGDQAGISQAIEGMNALNQVNQSFSQFDQFTQNFNASTPTEQITQSSPAKVSWTPQGFAPTSSVYQPATESAAQSGSYYNTPQADVGFYEQTFGGRNPGGQLAEFGTIPIQPELNMPQFGTQPGNVQSRPGAPEAPTIGDQPAPMQAPSQDLQSVMQTDPSQYNPETGQWSVPTMQDPNAPPVAPTDQTPSTDLQSVMQTDPSQYNPETGQWLIPAMQDPNAPPPPPPDATVPQGQPNEGWPVLPPLENNFQPFQPTLTDESPPADTTWVGPSGTLYNSDGTLADQSNAPRMDTGPIGVWSTDAQVQQALDNARGAQGAAPPTLGRLPPVNPWTQTSSQQDLGQIFQPEQQLPTPITPLSVMQYNLEPQGAPSEGWPTLDEQPSPIVTPPAEFGSVQPSTDPTEPIFTPTQTVQPVFGSVAPSTEPTEPLFTPTENTLPPPRPPENIPIENPPLPTPRPANATQTVTGPAVQNPRFLAGAPQGADNTVPTPNFGIFTPKSDIVAWVQQQTPGSWVNTPMGPMQIPQAGDPLIFQGQQYGMMPAAPQVATQQSIPGFARVPSNLDTSVAGDQPSAITPLSTTDYPYLNSPSSQAVSEQFQQLTPQQEQAATEVINGKAGANFDPGNPPGLMSGQVPLPPSRPFSGEPGAEPEENNPMSVGQGQPYATPEQLASNAGVPQRIAEIAASFIRAGGSATSLQQFMAQQGYPRSGAWCGEFAGSVVTAAGGQALPYEQAMVASNWANWGQAVNGLPQPGDIAVAAYQTHGPGRGQPIVVGNAGSHVTVVEGVNGDGTFASAGGNQGGPRNFPMTRYIFRRSF